MALTTRLWDAQKSTLTLSGNGNTIVTVGGYVRGLAGLAGATKSNALYKVIDALAAEPDPISLFPQGTTHPDDPSIVLTQIYLKGIQSHDVADVLLRYETPTGFPGTALILDVDSSLQSVERDKFPGTQQPIWVGWTGRPADDGSDKPKSAAIRRDTAPFSYLRPVVRVSATLLRGGTLDESTSAINAGVVGATNNNIWLGRPAGNWLMSGYHSSTSRYAGSYQIRAEAIAKGGAFDVYEDWRVLDVLRSRQTGLIAVPDPAKIDAALAAPYVFGAITKNAGHTTIYDPSVDGFIVHGPHVPVNFPFLWSTLIS